MGDNDPLEWLVYLIERVYHYYNVFCLMVKKSLTSGYSDVACKILALNEPH